MSKILFLLRLEWLKNRNYRPFWVLMALYGVMLPAFMQSGKNFTIPTELGAVETFFMFPNIGNNLAYLGSWLVFFMMGFLAVQAISTEVSNRTLRQNIISGLSRTDFFLSKFYFLTVINVALTVYFVLWALIFGLLNTETIYASKVYENSDIIPRFFLMTMGYTSFGLFLGVIFRRSILGLFVYFTYIMFIEKIIRYLLIRRILGQGAARFTPANALNDLILFPFFKMVKFATKSSNQPFFLETNEAALTVFIFTCLFFFGAFYLLKKRDL